MSSDSLLKSFVDIAPFINSLTMSDCAVAVCDTEKILVYVPGKTLDHKILPGDEVKPESVVGTAIRGGKRVIRQISKEVYGVPYVGIGVPIRDGNNKIIGAVSFNESLERQETLMEMANGLFSAIRDVTGSTESLAAQAEELAAVGHHITGLGSQLGNSVHETNGVLKVMKKITAQTNLLGLNASIEAARVGDKGKGFGVVADEIRKLSESSTISLKEIEGIIRTLNGANGNLDGEITQISRISLEQAAAVQAVMSAIEEVNAMAQVLLEFAEKLDQ